MVFEPWNVERLPEKTSAPKRRTPGQEAAERFLREVQPGDLDRLTEQHEPDERDRFMGVSTDGGGHVTQRYEDSAYPASGYNRPDRRYVDEEGEYGYLPGHEPAEVREGDYVMHPRPHFDPFGGFFDDGQADEEDTEPETYHVVTRRPGTIDPHDRTGFTEHRVHTVGNRYEYNPHEVWEQFAEEHPEFDHEENPEAEHEIVDVHPESHHDRWHQELDKEEADFDRIRQHGLHRESDIPGHQAYRYEEPNGVVHRLWHSTYSVNGPGWHTSRHDPSIDREHQPAPWTEHPDNVSEDSLGDALDQVERHKAMTR